MQPLGHYGWAYGKPYLQVNDNMEKHYVDPPLENLAHWENSNLRFYVSDPEGHSYF